MNDLLGAEPTPIVLVVDDMQVNRDLLEALLRNLGHDVRQASDGLEALARIDVEEPDLVLLDIDMPRLDGLAVCRQLKAHPTRRLIPVVLLTAHADRNTRLAGIAAGADDFLTKPFDVDELRVRTRVLLRDRKLNLRLDAAESVVLSLARIVEARDLYTIHHAERVGGYARELVRAMSDASEADLDGIYKAGILHDLGKILVPTAILLKSGSLDEEEWERIRRHPADGARIAEPLHSITHCLPVIRHHHERWDGGGYPDHLAGTDIPFSARTASVADAWDAMVSDRAYRPALPEDEALRRLRGGAGSQFDAALVDTFVELHGAGTIAAIAAAQLARGPVGR